MRWEKRGSATSVKEAVLLNTGLTEKELLYPKENYFISGLNDALSLLETSIQENRSITILGDYDCDGVTASAILYRLIKRSYQYSNLKVRLPKRFSEGYGLSMEMVKEAEPGGLLITVDNGISAVDEIAYAKSLGFSVIVLDHHLPREDGKLPQADVLVDPKAVPGSEFDGYCGAGLAYKLACLSGKAAGKEKKALCALAAIGTVADIVPLIYDNRIIVKEGLNAIHHKAVTRGLNDLLTVAGIEEVDETDIAFRIAPMINAASRMEDDGAMTPFRLLAYNSDQFKLAQRLAVLNEKRKQTTDEGMKIADQIIMDECLFGDKILVVYTTGKEGNKFFEGVVGIIAGKLSEQYHVPAIVLTESHEPGVLKGSGRSYGGVHMKKLLDKASPYLLHYGGHAGAVGLSLRETEVEAFRLKLLEAATQEPDGKVNEEELNRVYYDLEISASEIPKMLDEIERYAPFGEGNPKIVFRIQNYRLSPRNGAFYKLLGDGSTVKLLGVNTSAIGFGMTSKYHDLEEPKQLSLLGFISGNVFHGKKEIQVELIDIKKEENERATALSQLLSKKMAMF